MKANRRNFLKTAALGTGLMATSLTGCKSGSSNGVHPGWEKRTQRFNMCGYRAPALDVVRVGFIGLGMRGPGAVQRMMNIEGVEIAALGDKYSDRVENVQQRLDRYGLSRAKDYGGTEDAWKGMCEDPDIDLIYICTPWETHTPMSVYAMENGKHVGVELPAALTVEEAWQLVETSERTKKHCMMLGNCCYDFFELLTLNMARHGFFGDIIHGEGAYIHDLIDWHTNKDGYADMWRLKANTQKGNLYPTHGLGPISQIMNINRGDRFDYMNAMESNDYNLGPRVDELAKEDDFFVPFAEKSYKGNMNTSTIRTVKGRTIVIQHDVASPRPYSRIHLISGSKAFARKWPSPARVAIGHSWLNDEQMAEIEEKYTPEIVKRVGDMARKVGGHGGMDFMMDWRLIDCLRNGLPLDQDVYDAASWSVIAPLSTWSVKNRSNSIDIPDFTCGSWKSNTPVDISLKEGGSTGVRLLEEKDDVQLDV
ncbi:Gfo/Idh/MocA family oxidoreductase [Marinilabiliaceae bacterium ANBcel2]|nr:Gfo/Idh/MocA family oxidoreductase [Marinilabiliaceae bacterium ANBcel2]